MVAIPDGLTWLATISTSSDEEVGRKWGERHGKWPEPPHAHRTTWFWYGNDGSPFGLPAALRYLVAPSHPTEAAAYAALGAALKRLAAVLTGGAA